MFPFFQPPARKLTDMKGTGAIDVSEKSVSFVDVKQNDSSLSNQVCVRYIHMPLFLWASLFL